MAIRLDDEDFTDWDWLPQAATEAESYLKRLVAEGAIAPHDISARHKSITSYRDKCERKAYADPRKELTDGVAARVITYSVTDRDRVCDLIRGRFEVAEDFKPGDLKAESHRGYDCVHLVVTGEDPNVSGDWMVAGGDLDRYFKRFNGLEIQVRTVAAHALAEFEHHVRYKGAEYPELNTHDRETIDQLFGAASDARRALDETFIAIERVLSNPSSGSPEAVPSAEKEVDGRTPIAKAEMQKFLAERFPTDSNASPEGLEFACEIARASGLDSMEQLENALDEVDGEQVRKLMATTTRVTRVRRLDDELLALFGETYIDKTGKLGVGSWAQVRSERLYSRLDRLRGKVQVYELFGRDLPRELRDIRMSAARVVREIARAMGDALGPDAVLVEGAIATAATDLPPSTRAREVRLRSGESLWVATNLNRESSERIVAELFEKGSALDLEVEKSGETIASTQ